VQLSPAVALHKSFGTGVKVTSEIGMALEKSIIIGTLVP